MSLKIDTADEILMDGQRTGLGVTQRRDGTVVYTLVGRPTSYNPVAGGPGDASTITTTWSARGTAGLTRGTA